MAWMACVSYTVRQGRHKEKTQIPTRKGSKVKLPRCRIPNKKFLVAKSLISGGALSDSPSVAICPLAVPILVWQGAGCSTVISGKP